MIIWKKNYHKEFDPSQLLNKLKPFEKHYELWEDYMNQYSKTWHYFLGSFYLASFQMICRYWILGPSIPKCKSSPLLQSKCFWKLYKCSRNWSESVTKKYRATVRPPRFAWLLICHIPSPSTWNDFLQVLQ